MIKSLFLLEPGERTEFLFYGTREEKSQTKQSNFFFYGLRNGSDLRHMLYLANLACPSPAVGQNQPAGARYRRGSAKSTYWEHDFESIRRSERKGRKEKVRDYYFLLSISGTAGS